MRVFEIYRRLQGEVDATVVSGNYPGARDEIIDRVRYQRLGADRPYPWSRLTYAREATRLLTASEYDVGVFDFSVYTPIRIPRDRPVGLVVHLLHGPTARERWGRVGGWTIPALERRALRRARWICSTSRWMVCQLEAIASPTARILPVGIGVPPEFADVERLEGDYVLYYGRLDLFQKGIDTLLEAFRILGDEHPWLRLHIAGHGKDADRVRELAREMGVQDRVIIHAGVDRHQVVQLLSGALMLLMPSRLEGLPMVLTEAMAAGVPVIASAVGAIPEVLRPTAAGLLVPPDDPEALADAAAHLLVNTELRDRMSGAARRAAQCFSWEHVVRKHLQFLHLIADESGRTRTRSPSE